MSTPLTDLHNLQRFEIDDHIRIEELNPSYPVVHISNAHATATIALHGAHLTHYKPHGEQPVLFISKAAIYQEGKAIRGGIPICWPWFGAHPDADQNLPAHGYARTSFWKLTSTSTNEEGSQLTFELPATDGEALSATLEFSIAKTLTLKLTTHNLSPSEQRFSEALHSYFAVGKSTQTQVLGLDEASYIDTTGNEETLEQQDGAIDFPDEVDRIYESSETVVIEDRANPRKIIVDKQNSASTIVWNPGQTKGEAMADLLDSEIQQFICAESGNVRDQSIILKPGAQHTLELKISTKA
jgi:glucose-6-phosphate 1-epimerase